MKNTTMKRSTMTKKWRYCHQLVKQHLPGHGRCNLLKPAALVGGGLLNEYLKVAKFEEGGEYQVCCNIADKLKAYKLSNSTMISETQGGT